MWLAIITPIATDANCKISPYNMIGDDRTLAESRKLMNSVELNLVKRFFGVVCRGRSGIRMAKKKNLPVIPYVFPQCNFQLEQARQSVTWIWFTTTQTTFLECHILHAKFNISIEFSVFNHRPVISRQSLLAILKGHIPDVKPNIFIKFSVSNHCPVIPRHSLLAIIKCHILMPNSISLSSFLFSTIARSSPDSTIGHSQLSYSVC